MKIILYLMLSLFLLGCYSKPEPAPEWITDSVQDDSYWYGLGKADSREKARNAAFNEIASQINISITANLSRIITEHNLDINEYTRSIVQTRLDQNLSDIEIDRSYVDGSHHYLLARLSRQAYYEKITRQRSIAVNLALEMVREADRKLSSASFNLLGKAMQQIENYLDDPLQVEYPAGSGSKVSLVNLIGSKLIDFSQRIGFTTFSDNIELTYAFRDGETLQVQCVDKQQGFPVSGLPLRAILSRSVFNAVTDENGRAVFQIVLYKSSEQVYVVKIDADYSSILYNSPILPEPVTAGLFIPVSINYVKIYISGVESNLGTSSPNPWIIPEIKNYFAREYQGRFTDIGEADLIITTTAGSYKSNDKPVDYYGQQIYQAYANLTISVMDANSGTELIQKSVNNVKAVSFISFNNAGNEALKKLSTQLGTIILPALSEQL